MRKIPINPGPGSGGRLKFKRKLAVNMLLYVVTVLLGLLLMYLVRDFSLGGSNVLCGLLLGCMLVALGVLGVAFGEARTVVLNRVEVTPRLRPVWPF